MSSYDPYTAPQHGPHHEERPPRRRLTRRRHDKVVAGVCGGVADYLGVDANLVRLVLVGAVVLGAGSGILLYLAAWWLMPEA
ncbi:PspC domain-containing protein [Nocardioides sp. zg-536]|uniref:PspC domain-containing protein n=1 Tax=Nocardioides faecalis TaxID=2803858 RepID=A0A938Y7L8_9ACTN|nr:PspC domain-containing protein [Nocardioides faecalis]MBM9458704.1 PspC domain-containing protein [Nocardioides faecalis]MBS4753038.1 PspC domain-containing protein [Nocardioides faecalis]QVI58693.1 PspC domain-containing protein [Nocardioides faecalis]